MEFKKKRKKSISLDITPIVDTVFNLLIFFALSLNFTTASSLDVDLPKISTKQRSPARRIAIRINRNGDIFCNNILTGRAELLAELTSLKKNDKSIIIQADRTVHHGTVVRVMDICKKTGFHRLSIAAQIKD
jgi:biopolymer transport protein ExbD